MRLPSTPKRFAALGSNTDLSDTQGRRDCYVKYVMVAGETFTQEDWLGLQVSGQRSARLGYDLIVRQGGDPLPFGHYYYWGRDDSCHTSWLIRPGGSVVALGAP